MKHAREIMDLMASYPGREFRKVEIVRYVTGGKPMHLRHLERVRKQVGRALEAFAESGAVKIIPADRPRASGGYVWLSEVTHEYSSVPELGHLGVDA